jgi:NTE family protein
MAVPVVFAPIVVRTYPDRCEPLPPFLARLQPHADAPRELNAIAKALAAYRDPRTRYIKLADGGLTDNFGVSTLTQSHVIYGTPHAPMSEHDAVTIRRLLVVVVDASQGPHGDWIEQPSGPAGLELAFSATDAAIDAAARHAADAFERMVADWERSIVEYRCALTPADLKRLRAPARWECTDVKFSLAYLTVDDLPKPVRMRIEAVPTRLALDPAEIDTIIGGGRDGLLALQRLQGYVRGRIATSF